MAAYAVIYAVQRLHMRTPSEKAKPHPPAGIYANKEGLEQSVDGKAEHHLAAICQYLI
jgi:hypothetical protein